MKNFFSSMLGSLAALVIFSGLGVFLFIAIIIGVTASASQQQAPQVKPNSVLELRLQGEIVDRLSEEDMMFANFTLPGQEDVISRQSLSNILEAIKTAKTDDNIKGIYIKSEMFSAGFSTAKEIRDAILDFKDSGKFVVSYADNYTQKGYYIASAGDKVYLNPQGMLDVHGLASNVTYFKNTLEKIGVDLTVVKHGKYKAAVEPFTSDKMSDASREQTTRLISVLWDIYCTEVAESRDITVDLMNLYADKMLALQKPDLLLNYKLIDKLLYYDEMKAELKERASSDKKLKTILTSKYINGQIAGELEKEKIAVIYATGAIDGGQEGINSKKLVETISKARKNENIKAIVLRINSPGGSAYGSEQIWREVTLAREGKPFIVSMGDVAASGGYYIACAGHSIIAQPSTITGSIGIFGVFPNFSKFEEKIGLKFDGVKTNKMSDFLNTNRPVTSEEKRLLQNHIDRGYNTFITRCADGRKMTTEQIDMLGQGRVWTGIDALENGLVDKLGDLDDAIALAAEMSGLDNYSIKELPAEKPFMEVLMDNLNQQVKTNVIKLQLGEAYKLYEFAEEVNGMQGLQARMPFDMEVY